MEKQYKYPVLNLKKQLLFGICFLMGIVGIMGTFYTQTGNNLIGIIGGCFFIIGGLFPLITNYFYDNVIILKEKEICMTGFKKKRINYKLIKRVDYEKGGNGTFLLIGTQNDKLYINIALLENPHAIIEIEEHVKDKMKKPEKKDSFTEAFIENLNLTRHDRKEKESLETFFIPDNLDKQLIASLEIGGKEIFHTILNALKDNKGVHAESLLWYLGALGGYSCQATLREVFGEEVHKALVEVKTQNGETYYFGDYINNYLLSHKYSIWGLSAGIVEKITGKIELDLNNVVQYNSEVLGTTEYGRPRVGLKFTENPKERVKILWPLVINKVGQFCKDKYWPIMFGMAIQEAIRFSQNTVEPKIALQIVMDSAVAMSKVDIE